MTYPTLFVRLLAFSFAFVQQIRVASTNSRDLNAWFVAFTLLSGVLAGGAERKTSSVSNGRPRIHSAI
jgi:hypothetical protein